MVGVVIEVFFGRGGREKGKGGRGRGGGGQVGGGVEGGTHAIW